MYILKNISSQKSGGQWLSLTHSLSLSLSLSLSPSSSCTTHQLPAWQHELIVEEALVTHHAKANGMDEG
eukprot:COSAG03_NODE_2058_length_3168_cov_5.659824_2_plen_69_part_00